MKMKVLIVDDDAGLLETLAMIVSSMGHEPHIASTGDVALEILQSHPDIKHVITDYEMPGMDGLEFAKRAKVIRPELPIIMASGKFTKNTLKEPLPEGVSARILKPFEFATLAELLKQAA